MKRALALAILCLTTSCFGGKNAINLHGGVSKLTEDYGELEERLTGGLEVVVGMNDKGWGVEGAGFYAEEESGGVKLKTKELSLGARKTFLQGLPVQIYLGAGPNWMEGDITGVPKEDGIGVYGHAGVQLAILMFNLGLDFRGAYSGAKFGSERLNYGQVTLFLGLSF